MEVHVDESPTLDEIFDCMTSAVQHVDRGIVTGREATDLIAQNLADYLRSAADDLDSQHLAWELCRCAVEQVALHRDVRDSLLLDYFDEEVQSFLLGARLSEQLDLVLAELRVRAMFGDPDVREEIIQLAADGLRSQRLLLSLKAASERIVRTAHELCIPEALAAAVLPGQSGAQIADVERHPAEFRLALDLLGHLAAEPGSATGARSIDLLLDIAASAVDACAEAAARLPLHLLDENQRSRLLDLHEARVDLFTGEDAVCVPLGLETLRANRIIRTAIAQAFDICRL